MRRKNLGHEARADTAVTRRLFSRILYETLFESVQRVMITNCLWMHISITNIQESIAGHEVRMPDSAHGIGSRKT